MKCRFGLVRPEPFPLGVVDAGGHWGSGDSASTAQVPGSVLKPLSRTARLSDIVFAKWPSWMNHCVWAAWMTPIAAAASIVGTKASLGKPIREPKNSAITGRIFNWIAPTTPLMTFGLSATTAIQRLRVTGSTAENFILEYQPKRAQRRLVGWTT